MGTCGCGATWTGMRLEHCTVCHRTFTGTRSGDKHRTGSHFPMQRRCLTAEEMAEAGFRQNKHGQHWAFGPAWDRDSDFTVAS